MAAGGLSRRKSGGLVTTTGRAPRPSSTVSSVAALAMRRGAGMMPDSLPAVQLSPAFSSFWAHSPADGLHTFTQVCTFCRVRNLFPGLHFGCFPAFLHFSGCGGTGRRAWLRELRPFANLFAHVRCQKAVIR